MNRATAALAAALALVATLQPAGPAQAKPKKPNPCSPQAVSVTKQKIGSAVKARATALQHLATTLDAWTHVGADHRGVLNQLITADATALSQLGVTVNRQSVCRLVDLDGAQVVADYRIYSLVVPQTYLTVAADTGAYGASELIAAEPELRTGLEQLPETSRPQAQSLWNDLVRQAAAAQQTLTPIGDAVLSLSAGSYFPDTAAALGRQSRAVAAGSRSLSAALSDAERLQALLP